MGWRCAASQPRRAPQLVGCRMMTGPGGVNRPPGGLVNAAGMPRLQGMDIPLRGAAAGAERQTGLAQPLFIGNEIYRASRYGVQHPLSIPRVSTAMDLARAMGWLPAGQYRDCPASSPSSMRRTTWPP